MEYSQAKFKQLAVEYALKLPFSSKTGVSATELVAQAKIIEEYLVDTK